MQQSQSPKGSLRSSDITTTTTTTLLADSPSAIKQKFAEEVKKREDLQKELGLQVWYRKKSNNTEITSNFENFTLQKSMKAEMEMAMKLLEKDVHEKQDTIIALRDQLEDIKNINLEMYTKLQVFICLQRLQQYYKVTILLINHFFLTLLKRNVNRKFRLKVQLSPD